MNTLLFINKYLSIEAIVTIQNKSGDVVHSGLLHRLQAHKVVNTKVVKIEGLGSYDDIIITIEEKNDERKASKRRM